MLNWFGKHASSWFAPAAAPADAVACKNQGNAYLAAGRLDDAADCYRQAIALDPLYAEAHNNSGLVLLQQGQTSEALACFDRAIACMHGLIQPHINRGNALRAMGRIADAHAAFETALALDTSSPELHNNLGSLLHQQGRLAEALAAFRQAVALRPDFAEAHYNLACVLHDDHDVDAAAESFERALALKPDYAAAHNNLGNLHRETGNPAKALEHFRAAVACRPDFLDARLNLGNAYRDEGRANEAEACYLEILAGQPDNVAALRNLSLAQCDLGKPAAAAGTLRTALSLVPADDSARFDLHLSLGLTLLAQGNLAEGWQYHESRFSTKEGRARHQFPGAEWRGESLAGKSLLIWGEQGIGDEIMFAGTFSEAIDVARHCVIQCARKLVPLFARSFPRALVVPYNDPPHPATQQPFDYQCAAGELARWLRPAVDSFPNRAAFLAADSKRVRYWRERLADLGPGLRVGICWRSRLRNNGRQLHYSDLGEWGPIFALPGLHFVNLQYDECRAELNEARRQFNVTVHAFDEVDLLNDLDEAAALTQAMDAVITAPTAVSTMAGALNVPTWLMANRGTFWVSMGTQANPWFPAQRVHLRDWNQSWHPIIATVAREVATLADDNDQEPLPTDSRCAASAPDSTPDSAEDCKNRGNVHLSRGELPEASESYRRAIALDPRYAEARNNLGFVLLQQRKLKEAAIELEQAVHLKPELTNAHFNLGKAREALGDKDSAIRCYRQTLALRPDFAEAGLHLGRLLRERGELDEARSHLQQALAVRPGFIEAEIELGGVFQTQGRTDDALASFDRALARDPDCFEAHYNRGVVFFSIGSLEEAATGFRRALDRRPGFAGTLDYLGAICLRQGNVREAIECFEKLIALKPDAAGHNRLGVALANHGEKDRALVHFQRAVALDPDFTDAHYCLGNAYFELGRFDESVASFRRTITCHPVHGKAHNNLSVSLQRLGRLEEALACARKACELEPASAEFHNNQGLIEDELGRPQEAAESYREAIALAPDFGSAHYHLALALQKQEKLDEAIACNLQALSLQPDFSEAHINLGHLLQKKGKLDQALASVRNAVALAPKSAGAYNNLGLVLQDRGEFEAAETAFRKSISLDPSVGQRAHYNLALVLLSRGRLAEGWERYAARFSRIQGTPRREFPYPEWNGEALAGKSLLIWGEQGIGDEILFASMFADAVAAAGRCVIECAPKLAPLFARSFPGAEIVPCRHPPHPATHGSFDYQSAAGGLARWLRPESKSFPHHEGFLRPAPERLRYWRERLAELGPGPKLGVCWRSGLRTGARQLHYTSIEQWGSIFKLSGMHFVNLQYDECTDELMAAQQRFGVRLHAFPEVDLFNDLDEAAALTAGLDGVISAPTAASALAAAVGVPTWQMTYGGGLWTSLGTDAVPWFPAMRLCMRRWDETWEEVIAAVAAQVAALPH